MRRWLFAASPAWLRCAAVLSTPLNCLIVLTVASPFRAATDRGFTVARKNCEEEPSRSRLTPKPTESERKCV
jgi:hypothetical protein